MASRMLPPYGSIWCISCPPFRSQGSGNWADLGKFETSVVQTSWSVLVLVVLMILTYLFFQRLNYSTVGCALQPSPGIQGFLLHGHRGSSDSSCWLYLVGGVQPIFKIFVRRKFRSQTSDNMDRWKAEQGRGRREKIKIRREKSRRERVRRKKMEMREKVGKSRFTLFFQWFEAPEGRKVGSLKRRVRSQLARGEIKKLHAVVARSTFPSQNV